MTDDICVQRRLSCAQVRGKTLDHQMTIVQFVDHEPTERKLVTKAIVIVSDICNAFTDPECEEYPLLHIIYIHCFHTGITFST